jgi:outer membrane protein assembly factor BamD
VRSMMLRFLKLLLPLHLEYKFTILKLMSKYIVIALFALALSSCGEYQQVLKSNDYDYKLEFAKRAFDQKKYVQASTVLSDIVTVFKGTSKAEETLYLLALSYYENKDYTNSAEYFHLYYTRYPKGKYAELARFYSGYGYYLDSPEPQLDQSGTMKAIEELQGFLDFFPRSDKVSIAQNAIFELQDKLTLKELQNAQLYYNLGNFMGNNYESAVIVAQNAVKNYPYSKYKEDLELLILKARYQEAAQSVDEKKAERFREVLDEYDSFINNYPDTANRSEADNIYKIASKYAAE